MKSRILLVAIALVALLSLSSCSIYNHQVVGQPHYVNVKISKTLDRYSAIANRRGKTIKLVSYNEVYYDDLRVTGTFCLVDSFLYEVSPGEFRTIPVYMRLSEYNKVYRK